MKIVKAKYIIGWIIIVLLSFAILLTWHQIYTIRFSYKDFISPTLDEEFRQGSKITELWDIQLELGSAEYKQLIIKEFDTPHILIEKDWKSDQEKGGYSIPLLRIAVVNKNGYIGNYLWAIAHELTHIKYQTGNETFVSYQMFVELYESNNKDLQKLALKYAGYQITGSWQNEYDCSGLIYKYLINKGII